MKKQRMIWMTGGALLLVILIVIIQQFMTSMTSASPITEEEARELINERYPNSEVLTVEETADVFDFTFKTNAGEYQLLLNREDGSIASLEPVSVNAQDDQPIEELLTEEQIREKANAEKSGEITNVELLNEGDSPQYKATIEEGNTRTILYLNAVTGEVDTTEEETIEEAPPSEAPAEPEPAKIITADEAGNIALTAVAGEIDDIEQGESNGVPYYLVEIETEEDDATVQVNAISGEVINITWDD
ncbi:PepSY domain-containing protein [Jeotgalibacillus sp. R-1-5s-1]|uniref:PepSY domain-containing protein n=1 Tax=Jeotgalibacillus sp. R-1-5s-1 TaxID=2555897 RepID=UPI00106B4BA5|nr:PepSY domain-containing protein [Jeotgalibacillus sp. R-1-5s-1]TFD97560.1 hypothetical protein E2491_09005 [Jeotgalibacillus sp. R-1-5s-1]